MAELILVDPGVESRQFVPPDSAPPTPVLIVLGQTR
jgi:hypothetical protein